MSEGVSAGLEGQTGMSNSRSASDSEGVSTSLGGQMLLIGVLTYGPGGVSELGLGLFLDALYWIP